VVAESINELDALLGTREVNPSLPLQFPNSESDECLLSFEFGVAVYPVGALQDIAFDLLPVRVWRPQLANRPT
jgi:hypothetical protein